MNGNPVSHDAGPIAHASLGADTASSARTTSGSNCRPLKRTSSSSPAARVRARLYGPRCGHRFERVGDRNDASGEEMCVRSARAGSRCRRSARDVRRSQDPRDQATATGLPRVRRRMRGAGGSRPTPTSTVCLACSAPTQGSTTCRCRAEARPIASGRSRRRQMEFGGDHVGVDAHPLGVATGVPVVGTQRADQGQDLFRSGGDVAALARAALLG